ncbi:copper transporter [Nakamurella antarctica]|uniref:Copper transporter n=1 Tax=Nakamurella antarctica TaxID=1902245 RepID=A0A3G8ZLD0_9ACTN|nr:copper transporter [Nakamurella antarctica]AZI57587.1 copper transporter [Nakamurella antarctica]
MISMRYHIVSLAAVFLALALGIVLGATKISSPLLAGLQGDANSLTAERDALKKENATLSAGAASSEDIAAAVGDVAVRGIFRPSPTVVLITTADANSADRDAVLALLGKAGAVLASQVQLTADFTDPSRAQEVRSLVTSNIPAGQKLPEVQDVGTLMGSLLSLILVADESGSSKATEAEATQAMSALTTAGFIRSSGALKAGRLVVVLTGGAATGGSEGDRAAAVASLAAQLKTTANGVVLAGRQGSATAPTGAVGVIRADTADSASVTTVDDVDLASGRLATVLGLAEQDLGKAGRYGSDVTAQARIPSLAT